MKLKVPAWAGCEAGALKVKGLLVSWFPNVVEDPKAGVGVGAVPKAEVVPGTEVLPKVLVELLPKAGVDPKPGVVVFWELKVFWLPKDWVFDVCPKLEEAPNDVPGWVPKLGWVWFPNAGVGAALFPNVEVEVGPNAGTEALLPKAGVPPNDGALFVPLKLGALGPAVEAPKGEGLVALTVVPLLKVLPTVVLPNAEPVPLPNAGMLALVAVVPKVGLFDTPVAELPNAGWAVPLEVPNAGGLLLLLFAATLPNVWTVVPALEAPNAGGLVIVLLLPKTDGLLVSFVVMLLPKTGALVTGFPNDGWFGTLPNTDFVASVLPNVGAVEVAVLPNAGTPEVAVLPNVGAVEAAVPPNVGAVEGAVLPNVGAVEGAVLPNNVGAVEGAVLPNVRAVEVAVFPNVGAVEVTVVPNVGAVEEVAVLKPKEGAGLLVAFPKVVDAALVLLVGALLTLAVVDVEVLEFCKLFPNKEVGNVDLVELEVEPKLEEVLKLNKLFWSLLVVTGALKVNPPALESFFAELDEKLNIGCIVLLAVVVNDVVEMAGGGPVLLEGSPLDPLLPAWPKVKPPLPNWNGLASGLLLGGLILFSGLPKLKTLDATNSFFSSVEDFTASDDLFWKVKADFDSAFCSDELLTATIDGVVFCGWTTDVTGVIDGVAVVLNVLPKTDFCSSVLLSLGVSGVLGVPNVKTEELETSEDAWLEAEVSVTLKLNKLELVTGGCETEGSILESDDATPNLKDDSIPETSLFPNFKPNLSLLDLGNNSCLFSMVVTASDVLSGNVDEIPKVTWGADEDVKALEAVETDSDVFLEVGKLNELFVVVSKFIGVGVADWFVEENGVSKFAEEDTANETLDGASGKAGGIVFIGDVTILSDPLVTEIEGWISNFFNADFKIPLTSETTFSLTGARKEKKNLISWNESTNMVLKIFFLIL